MGALRVTSVARTLADVGREWDVVDTVVAMDDALADGRITTAELVTAVKRQSHWPHVGRSARAAGLARVGAHSPHETRTRLAFVGAGLPEPLLQAAILQRGRLVGIVDELWREEGVFSESDGKVKVLDPWRGRTPEEAVWAEKRRHDALLDLDLRGVRVAPADLFGPLAGKVARVRALLEAGRFHVARYEVEQWRGGLRTTPRWSAA